MNIAFQNALTVQQYLDWASTQTDLPRTELINGRIVAMTPERVEHVEVKIAIVLTLKAAIASAQVRSHALGDGMTVRIDDHTAYEPDALVYCGERLKRGSVIAPNPVLVVEVPSPTTRHSDTSAKLIGYFKVPSVRHYLIVDPDERVVMHHACAADGTMSAQKLTVERFRLDPLGIEVNAGDFFESA